MTADSWTLDYVYIYIYIGKDKWWKLHQIQRRSPFHRFANRYRWEIGRFCTERGIQIDRSTMLRKWSSTSRRLRVIDSRQRHSKQSKHFGVARRAWPWRIVATPIIVPARSVIRPKRPSSENIVASGLSGGSMQFYNGTCRMLYPSRSTGPFVAISLFLAPFISLSLSFPHRSFMSFRIGNNARFNVNTESIDGERSCDERAFIRFIYDSRKLFKIDFSRELLIVIIDYRGYFDRYSFGCII